jgi:hypothetical protein
MMECVLTKAGLTVVVRSQSRPESKVIAEVGFDKDVAVIAIGACAEEINQKFGDSLSPAACVAGLKEFFRSGVDLKCRSCGWRKPGRSKTCTLRALSTSDSDTCGDFRHEFVVEMK